MNYTRILSLLLCILLLAGLCGCGNPDIPPEITESSSLLDTQPTTEPAQLSTEPTADTKAPLPPAEPENREGYIPFLVAIAPEETGRESKPESIRVYEMAWDVEHGGLTEPEAWYDKKLGGSLLASYVHFWAGGTFVTVIGKRMDPSFVLLADGLRLENREEGTYFGSAMLVPQEPGIYTLTQVEPDGTKTELPTPVWPEELYEASSLELVAEPYYAWTDGETVFLLLMAYDDEEYATDMVYTTYQVDAPEEAVWNTASVPFAQAMDILTNSTFVYNDDCLYAGSMQAAVKLDTVTGELTILDVTNLFKPVFGLLSDAYWSPNHVSEQNVYMMGCWQDNIIFELSLWTDTPEQTCHTFYVAVKDGVIQGVMDRSDWGHFAFYDENMNLLREEDRYTDTLYPMSLKFPLNET